MLADPRHRDWRRAPTGEVETFAAADDIERVDEPMATEDLAHILVRFGGRCAVVRRFSGVRRPQERDPVRGRGSRGCSPGTARRRAAVARPPRRPERGARNPTLGRTAHATTHLPAGHAEGFADTFRECTRVYRAVAR